jgi:hypothetical protein
MLHTKLLKGLWDMVEESNWASVQSVARIGGRSLQKPLQEKLNNSTKRSVCRSAAIFRTTILAAFALGLVQSPAVYSQAKASSNWQADFKKHILNSVCCVPNLQSGYTPRKLSNGEWKSGDESVSVGNLVFGYMDKKRVAVAILGNCTGGSGVFDSLILYEEQNGLPVEVGSQGFSDRGIVKSLTISNGKVHLVSEESHGEEQGKRKTLDLARKDFDPVQTQQN